MKIKFLPVNADATLTEAPRPARNFIPDWYKNVEQPHLKNLEVGEDGIISNPNIKMCPPFLDSLMSGYIVSSWCDIYIKLEDGMIKYYYSAKPEALVSRKDINYPALDTDSFYEVEFAWQMQWMPKTPKGYSVLITHPLNRVDLPFYTLSGVIDSDNFYHHGPGNLPFFIKKGFVGIIPAGTPLYQITPIKREKWKSEVLPYDEFIAKKRELERFRNFFGSYKNKWWVKKEFN